MFDSVSLIKKFALTLVLGVVVFFFADWRSHALPPASEIRSELESDPQQIPITDGKDAAPDDWTCFAQMKTQESFTAFDADRLTNNHLLPADKDVARVIRQARVGDQIHLSGFLVDDTHDGFTRHTSTVRTDRGNGACEVTFVSSAEVLASHGFLWHRLVVLAKLVIMISIAGLLGGLVAPLIARRHS